MASKYQLYKLWLIIVQQIHAANPELITYNHDQGSTSSSHDVDNEGEGVLASVSIVKRPDSPFVNLSDSETLHINDIQPDRLK
jgi:hypothetical protein